MGGEFLGTFWLVIGGCGTAVLAAMFGGTGNPLGVGLLGVSFAFGLSLMSAIYAFGHISGGHFNPAVSFGFWVAGRFPARELVPYILAQVAGGILAGGTLYWIAQGAVGFSLEPGVAGSFASNGYGELSPGGYSMGVAILVEVLMTSMFVGVILAVTDNRALRYVAPVAIGLALVLVHLISIPVTNTSVNPARSTGVAWVAGEEVLDQLWLFWLSPLAGAVLGGCAYRLFGGSGRQ